MTIGVSETRRKTKTKAHAIEILGNEIGAVIKANRLERGWSQRELGQKLECSRAFVSLIENGKRIPSIGVLQRTVPVFKKELADLFKETGDADERLKLALNLRKLAQSGSTEQLRSLVEFAQGLAETEGTSQHSP